MRSKLKLVKRQFLALTKAYRFRLKPRQHSNNVEATLANATSRTILSTKSKKLTTLSKGRNFRKNSFDIVAKTTKISKQRSTLSKESFDL